MLKPVTLGSQKDQINQPLHYTDRSLVIDEQINRLWKSVVIC